MKRLRFDGRLVTAVAAGFVLISTSGRPPRATLPSGRTDDPALFVATVASLADSVHAIEKMLAVPSDVHLRIDPRPLRVVAPRSSDLLGRLASILQVDLDSIDGGERLKRVAKVRASGFALADLKALDRCPPARVSAPGGPPPPPPCTLGPAAVAGIGVQKQTSRDATVRVVILVVLPYLQIYSADFVFSREDAWRLAGRSPWTIAE